MINGRLNSGVIAMGTIWNDKWVRQAAVVEPGEYQVILKITADGPHDFVIFNNGSESLNLEIRDVAIYSESIKNDN